MKNGPCPKCQSRDLIHVEDVQTPDTQSANLIYSSALTAHYGPSGETGFFGAKNTRVAVYLEAFVCAKCSYTELYAKNLPLLAELAGHQQAGARKLTR